MKKLIAISLFSGMGGFDLGIKKAGFYTALQVDIDKSCIETLKKNWRGTKQLREDISKLNAKKIFHFSGLKKKEVDLIVGGPSCQPFSRANEGKRKGLKDRRGKMIFEFARLVNEVKPKAFIMENVGGLISSNKGRDFKKLMKFYENTSYNVFYKVLNAAEYGVPQKRKRLFLVGFKKRINFDFPSPTHGESAPLKPFVSVKEVISDMDDGIVHNAKRSIGGKHGHLLNRIPPGMNYIFYTKEYGYKNPLFKDRSKFWTFLLKLNPHEPSTTIQAQPWNSVGPFHWNNRRLTLEEIKRIQGIPDNYYIAGVKKNGDQYGSPAWQQVGNAVPPQLAYTIAKKVKSALIEN